MRFILLILLTSCGSSQYVNSSHAIVVYKTKKNYNHKVAVTLNTDKTSIINYPDPSDIISFRPYPIQLKSKYLLDQRGIDSNVAFLKLSYRQYSKLKVVPEPNFILSNLILDNDPILEFHVINQYPPNSNVKQLLNQRIVNGVLK
jgi:hypothetical protein